MERSFPYRRLAHRPRIPALRFLVLFCTTIALFFPASTLRAGAQGNVVVPLVDIFKPVASVTPNKRVDTARAIYKARCRKMPEQVAMSNLDNLTLLSHQLNDLALESSVYELRADYYSVNKGFNQVATDYYQQAINFAQSHDLILQQGIYTHKKAIYYALYKHNTAACKNFLNAQDIFNRIGYTNVPDIGIYLWELGEFYYSIGDYDECRHYLDQGLQYNVHSLRNRVNMTNTLGLIYRNRQQYTQALGVFNKVLNMAAAGKDTAWIGIENGNIGSVYFMQKQYAKALPYIQTDYNVSVKYHESLNAAIALLRLAQINFDANNLPQTDAQLNTVATLLTQDKTNTLKYQTQLYKLRAEYFERVNNLKQALAYRQKYEAAQDSLVKQDNMAAIDRISLRWEMDKRIIELSQMKANSQIATIKLACIIAILLIVMLTYGIIYRRKIAEAQKDKEVLLTERIYVDEELKSATTALNIYIGNIKQKNEAIEQYRKKIEQMQAHVADEAEIEKLDKLVKTHIMTDETWNEFKKLFSNVHSRFFHNLSALFPNISLADTRLLALTKLGLNNREMANMLGITIEGIKKAKQRLRKKMNLSPDESLEKLIVEI